MGGVPEAERYQMICGNAIELYVDTSDVWHTEPQAVASIAPLVL